MENNELDNEEIEEVDYKSLYEEQQNETAQEREKREKAEGRFKKTAKELNEYKSKPKDDNGVDVNATIEKRISEEMYYIQNPVAKEYKSEIETLRKDKNLSIEDTYELYLAKNKPELLIKQSSPWVDGVATTVEPQKSINEMSLSDIDEALKNRVRG